MGDVNDLIDDIDWYSYNVPGDPACKLIKKCGKALSEQQALLDECEKACTEMFEDFKRRADFYEANKEYLGGLTVGNSALAGFSGMLVKLQNRNK